MGHGSVFIGLPIAIEEIFLCVNWILILALAEGSWVNYFRWLGKKESVVLNSKKKIILPKYAFFPELFSSIIGIGHVLRCSGSTLQMFQAVFILDVIWEKKKRQFVSDGRGGISSCDSLCSVSSCSLCGTCSDPVRTPTEIECCRAQQHTHTPQTFP